SAGRWLAPDLTKGNHQRRDRYNSDPIGQEPCAPNIPKWRSGMEQVHCRGTSESGSCGSEAGGDHKSQHAAQVIKGKWATEPMLDQPGHQDSFACVTKALEQRGPNVPVAHEIGSNSADYHADHNRWADAPI